MKAKSGRSRISNLFRGPCLIRKASYTVNAIGEYNSILLNVTPEGFLAGVGSGNTNRTRDEEIVYEEKEKSVGTGINYVYFGIRSPEGST